MKNRLLLQVGLVLLGGLWLAGCSAHGAAPESDGTPTKPRVIQESDGNVFAVGRPEQFPLATATKHAAPSELTVTGTVNPDIARAVTEGLEQGGILPILKHIPGHGRATAESHLALPVVDTPQNELEKPERRSGAAVHGAGSDG